MAQSQLALYNMAVGACGGDYTISAVAEESVPAEVCELFYENVRQTVFRAAFWACAKRHDRMTKAAARDATTGYDSDTDDDWVDSDPEPGFAFSYTLPSNLLRCRYLSTFELFSLGWEEEGAHKILSCNSGGVNATDAPILCYTVDVTDVTLWEPDLYQAVAYGLAAHIAMPLTGSRSKLGTLLEVANSFILEARANTANEIGHLIRARQAPERLQARGYAYSPVLQPYVYPYGHLLTGTGAGVV